MQRIFTNWRKTATLFLLPAVLMMLALNLFPMIINFISTGSLTSRPIVIVNAPDSFIEYLDEDVDSHVFNYEFWDYDKLTELRDNEGIQSVVKNGTVICTFWSGKNGIGFDDEISYYYTALNEGEYHTESKATVYVAFSASSFTGRYQAEQFKQGVLEKYQDTLIDTLGGDYAIIGSSLFSVDGNNLVTRFMNFRTNANAAASRVIPGILLILMYYCVYSLSEDMFAQEKDRGFLTKLYMTPVGAGRIIIGKSLAIIAISSASTYVTMTVMFFVSWINRSNSAMSLLPFGLFLTPVQLLIVAVTVPVTCFLMTAMCLTVVFSLDRLQDTIVNLQLPLILFLADFFIQMFRSTRPVTFEYFIPLHNSLEIMSETFNAQDKFWHVAVLVILNSAIAALIFMKVIRRQRLCR